MFRIFIPNRKGCHQVSVQQPHPRVLIVSGGRLGEWASALLATYDCIIGADRGAEFVASNGFRMKLAVGDFDSVTQGGLDLVREFSDELLSFDAVDKDWTDTELALREAVSRGFRDIDMIGALGTRFDHTLANVHLLKQAQELECSLRLIDEQNEIRLCTNKAAMRIAEDSRYENVSLLPLSETVTGVTLEGFRYPLRDAAIKLGQSIGVSNVLVAATGTITIGGGLMLVIRSRD